MVNRQGKKKDGYKLDEAILETRRKRNYTFSANEYWRELSANEKLYNHNFGWRLQKWAELDLRIRSIFI